MKDGSLGNQTADAEYVRAMIPTLRAIAAGKTQHSAWDLISDAERLLRGESAIGFDGPTALADLAAYLRERYGSP